MKKPTSDQVRNLRKAMRMTQKQMAENFPNFFSYSAIKKYENGQRKMPILKWIYLNDMYLNLSTTTQQHRTD
jgi:transcriptional regulator with XRE-family HTH domain